MLAGIFLKLAQTKNILFLGGVKMQDKNREQVKKEKKVDNLINIVENHTRTLRHLEQYSEIGDLEFKEMARDKQKVREEQIGELKDQLVGVDRDIQTKGEQLEGTKTRYEFAQGYMENYGDKMNPNDLENLQKKQEHRREQIKNLEEDR